MDTLKHHPQKIAAIEALWETERGAPLVLFALPNEHTCQNDWALEIPNLASLIVTHDWNGELKGLNEFVGNHPPVAPIFWAFRIMVGMVISSIDLFLDANETWSGYWVAVGCFFQGARGHCDAVIPTSGCDAARAYFVGCGF